MIGVWTHLADTSLEYAGNIRALVEVIGIDHVCLGTDTKMTPGYKIPAPEGTSRTAPAERIGERTNQVWKNQTAGFLYPVTDALLKTGFTAKESSKIIGENFCRVLTSATTNGH